MTSPSKKFALFASGRGSNAMAIVEYLRTDNLWPKFILSNKKAAKVLDSAKVLGLKTIVIENTNPREIQEDQIMRELAQHKIELVFLAGYMRVLSKSFVDQAKSNNITIINIHPSLLPKFPGLHAYERAWEERVCEHGVTVHYVDAGVDTGKIIEQVRFSCEEIDSFEDFVGEGLKHEHQIYPRVAKEFILGHRNVL